VAKKIVDPVRLAAAQQILDIIAPTTKIITDRPGIYIQWEQHRGVVMLRRWQLNRGSDSYPVWYGKWGHGGTCTQALAQLVRWLQNKTVLPLSSWKYWTGESVALGQQRRAEIVPILQEAGYPEIVNCVLCNKPTEGLDWWHLNKVVGPCCGMSRGCRQKGSK
jgi:hypothetical protein